MKSLVLTTILLFFFTGVGCSQDLPDTTGVINAAAIPKILQELDTLYIACEYNKAIEKVLMLDKYYLEKGDVRGEVWCNDFLGDVLRAIGNYPVSQQYFYKALQMNALLNDSVMLIKIYNHLAALYVQYNLPGRNDSIEYYANKSMEGAKKLKNDRILYGCLNILGVLDRLRMNYPAAIKKFEEAKAIVKRSYPIDESLILCNEAMVYSLINRWEKAEKLLLDAYSLAERMHVTAYIRLSSDLLSKVYVKKGDYRKAYFFLTVYMSITQKNIEEKARIQVRDLYSQIEMVKKERELVELRAKEDLNDQERRSRILWILFLLVMVICAGIFMLLFAYQKRRLKKTNQELLNLNRELTHQKEQVEKIAHDFNTTNATLKKFISIIAHDLKNPFNTIIGFSDLLRFEYDTLTPDERRLAVENTNKSAVNAFALLEQLLEWARLQTGTIRPTLIPVDLDELIEEVTNLLQTSAFFKKQHIIKKTHQSVWIKADRNMMLTVIRNLVSNAVKFTPDGGQISISATPDRDQATVIVRDSGIGIPPEEMPKLFRLDEQLRTDGTAGEKGTGIGLLLCKEYLEKNNGTITAQSRQGEGTTFIVKIPLLSGEGAA